MVASNIYNFKRCSFYVVHYNHSRVIDGSGMDLPEGADGLQEIKPCQALGIYELQLVEHPLLPNHAGSIPRCLKALFNLAEFCEGNGMFLCL